MATLDVMAGQYVALRDKLKTLREEWEETEGKYKDAMSKLEGRMLLALDAAGPGTKHISTTAGTVERALRRRAQVADWDAFLWWVIGEKKWEMFERRVGQTASLNFYDETHKLPPGLSLHQEIGINVKRPRETSAKGAK